MQQHFKGIIHPKWDLFPECVNKYEKSINVIYHNNRMNDKKMTTSRKKNFKKNLGEIMDIN